MGTEAMAKLPTIQYSAREAWHLLGEQLGISMRVLPGGSQRDVHLHRPQPLVVFFGRLGEAVTSV
jgi:hypothetical protein